MPDRRPLSGPERLLLAAAVLLVWFLAWGHPLMPPDEGRYGSVAARMAETGEWLVPQFQGRAHLTKPPLTYWLQAVGVTAFGRTEMAVRWPSLLATSLTLLALFAWTRRVLGTRPALIATAIASVMPYVLVVGRLANTDALVALFWTVALAAGHRLMSEPDAPRQERLRSACLLWSAVALGFLTKREVAFGPLLILGAWALLAWRPRDLLRLRPFVGLPLALLPFGLWTGLILLRHPEAGQIWWDETIGRVTGEKDLRAEPWWFYIPIFLGGMYPASTMLVLPWFNLSWRTALGAFRTGEFRALLLIAILFPFLGFSVSTGKLATYLLPLAAPTAILTAITIERWLRGEFDGGALASGYRPPDVRRTLAVVAILVFVGELTAAFVAAEAVPELWPLVIPLAIAPIGCITCWRLWNAGLTARLQGLLVGWCGLALAWTIVFGIQTRFTSPMGADQVIAYAERSFGVTKPDVVLIGFVDPTIEFYNQGHPTRWADSLASLAKRNDLTSPAIVLIDERLLDDQFEEALTKAPGLAMRLSPMGTWTRWFGKRTKILVLTEQSPTGGVTGS